MPAWYSLDSECIILSPVCDYVLFIEAFTKQEEVDCIDIQTSKSKTESARFGFKAEPMNLSAR